MDSSFDSLLSRKGLRFQLGVEGDGAVQAAHPLDGRVQSVKCLAVRNYAGNLPAKSGKLDSLMDDDGASGFFNRGDNGVCVQGGERPQVQDLHVNALFRQFSCGLQTHLHHAPVCDDGHVAPGPFYVRLSQRDKVFFLGYFAFFLIQSFLLQKHDGVVVPNGGFQKSFGIVWGGGDDHLQTRDMTVHLLQRLGVLGGGAGAAA